MRREQQSDAREELGATLQPAVLLPAEDDTWTLFRQLCGNDGEQLLADMVTNNSTYRIAEFQLHRAIVAEVYVFPNGQVCSSVITLDDETYDEDAHYSGPGGE